jgi:hypothetical protein
MPIPNRAGITNSTKNSDLAGAMRLMLKVRYNGDMNSMLRDLNAKLKVAERQDGKKVGTYQVSRTTFQRWLKVGTSRADGKPLQKIGEDKQGNKIIKDFVNFHRLPKQKLTTVVSFLNKGLKKAPLEYKSSCKFAFNLTKDRGYVTFLTGFATFKSVKQIVKPSLMREVIREMIKKLTDHNLIVPSSAVPKVTGIPFEGNFTRKNVPTADEAKFLMDLVKNPKLKPERKIHGVTYKLHGSFSIWYCYKLTQTDYPCFDHTKVDIGPWIDYAVVNGEKSWNKEDIKKERRRRGLFGTW